MLTKEEFTKTHPELRMGMKVYDKNNEKLGEIEDLTDQGLVIGKGWLLPKFSTIAYDDIIEIRGDRVIISRESRAGEGWRREEAEEREEYQPSGEERAGMETEEARIPVREEEVEVSKRPVVKEEIRVRKETRTEPEEVSGEARKEDVRVERSDTSEKKHEK